MVKIRFGFIVRYFRQMITKGKTFDSTELVEDFLIRSLWILQLGTYISKINISECL